MYKFLLSNKVIDTVIILLKINKLIKKKIN